MENNKSTLVKKLFLLTMISLLLIFSLLGLNLFNTNKSLSKPNFINTNDSETTYKQVETGHAFSGAVLNDGTTDHLYTWGSNKYGQLGNGKSGGKEHGPIEVTQGNFELKEGQSIKQISFGWASSMAIFNDGEKDHLYSWGTQW